ncbi:MAG: PAS domain S-box protein [Planctomycetaceae bacterium]|nr:MAG: PAS domain S-box protein [Planctomycetaceae bacterium]
MSESKSIFDRDDKALQQEARFFHVSIDLFLIIDLKGFIRRANPSVQIRLGYQPEEVVGLSIFTFLLPDDHQRVRQAIDAAANGQEIVDLECRCVHQNGSIRRLMCSCPPVVPNEDELLVVCRDITESWHAEQRFRKLVDVSPTGIILVDADGCITFANPQAEQQFGYTLDEMVGKEIELLIPQRFHQQHRQARAKYDASPEPRPVGVGKSLRAQHQDGHEFPVDIALTPIVMQGRSMVACTIVDLSERETAQKALAEGDGRLRQIMDNAMAVMYLKNVAGRYLLINRQFEELFKVTQRQVVGKTDYDIFPPEIAEAFRANDQHVLDTGEVARVEEIAPHDDGLHTYVSVKFPLRNSESQIYAVGGISTDITDRVQRIRYEHELQAAGRVQQHLYPTKAPELEGFDVAGAVFPATEACGDYFDYVPLSESVMALVVGDVAGHGPGPALQMVETRTYLRAMLGFGASPLEALSRLNRLLVEDTPQEAFVTLFLAVLDVRQHGFVYVGAGHEARLIRASGAVEELESTGLALGILPDAPLRQNGPKALNSGDILLMLTDGILETHSPKKELFGWGRTLDTLRAHRHKSSEEIIDALYATTCDFSEGQPRQDDLTVLVAKVL